MSDCERIMVVDQLMKVAQFGPENKERSVVQLLSEGVIKNAYPIHDGCAEWSEVGQLSDRQVLWFFFES